MLLGLVPGVVVGGGVVEFVEADCVAPAGDGAGGLVGLAGVVPGIFEGFVGGHGRPGLSLLVAGGESGCSTTKTRLSCVGSGPCRGGRAAFGVGARSCFRSGWLLQASGGPRWCPGT